MEVFMSNKETTTVTFNGKSYGSVLHYKCDNCLAHDIAKWFTYCPQCSMKIIWEEEVEVITK